MAADPELLVNVRGRLPRDEQGRVYQESGSGLRVTDELVLTAAHVVVGDVGPLEVSLRFHDGSTAIGTVVWPGAPQVDAALVRVEDGQGPRFGGRPPAWGRFTGRDPRQPVDATGFPLVMVHDGCPVEYQLSGVVNPQGARRQGRYLVSVDSPPATPRAGQASPWAGMSGAALMSGGSLVGVIVIDTPGFDSDLLTAVPAATIAADPAVRELVGLPAYLPSVELDPLLVRPTVTRGSLSPAQLLRADEGVVRFLGRDAELADLGAWCTGRDEFGARLVVGPGGRGKTRLAQQLVDELRHGGGWLAGLVAGSANLDFGPVMTTVREHSVLLVVDYAESRAPQLDRLLLALSAAASPPKVRLLLLARDEGEWWQTLCDSFPALLDPEASLVLPPLHNTLPDREAAFFSYVEQLAARLIETDPGTDWAAVGAGVRPDALDGAGLGDPLSLQLKSLLALLEAAGGPQGSGSLETRLIAHEREYWRSTLEAQHLDLSPRLRDHAVAAATLIAVRNRAAALELLQRVPELTQPGKVADWLRSLYPTESQLRYWGPLQPDRLGEHLVGYVTRDDPGLLGHLLAGDDVAQLQDALVVIGRAIGQQPHLEQQLQVLAEGGRQVVLTAIEQAAARIPDPLPLLRTLPHHLSAQSTYYDENPDFYGDIHGSSVPERLSDASRGIGGNPFTSSNPYEPDDYARLPDRSWEAGGREHERLGTEAYERGNLVLAAHEFGEALADYSRADPMENMVGQHRARVLLARAAALADMRDYGAAYQCSDEGVSMLRVLVDQDEAPRDALGRALDLHAGILAEAGLQTDALSFAQEAVKILEKHAATTRSNESARDLAKALASNAALLERSGRIRDANRLSARAVQRFESLHQGQALPAEDASYGRALLTRARIALTAEELSTALDHVDRALAEFDRIAAAMPHGERSMAADHAAAQEFRAQCLAAAGRTEEAIRFAAEAAAEYAVLAELRPAFVIDHARSLVALAELLLGQGQSAMALRRAQLSVALLDGLSDSDPRGTQPRQRTRLEVTAHDVLDRARAATWA
ncbi:MAG: trypsin-like peptidase domain-containing protein [Kribbellaceae bacterium]